MEQVASWILSWLVESTPSPREMLPVGYREASVTGPSWQSKQRRSDAPGLGGLMHLTLRPLRRDRPRRSCPHPLPMKEKIIEALNTTAHTSVSCSFFYIWTYTHTTLRNVLMVIVMCIFMVIVMCINETCKQYWMCMIECLEWFVSHGVWARDTDSERERERKRKRKRKRDTDRKH